MNFEFNKINDNKVVSLEGRLDALTAPDFESFLLENYDGEGTLIIDCAKLSYISSAGLRVLLIAQKRSNGNMKLTNACELVMEVIQMTGFADILRIE